MTFARLLLIFAPFSLLSNCLSLLISFTLSCMSFFLPTFNPSYKIDKNYMRLTNMLLMMRHRSGCLNNSLSIFLYCVRGQRAQIERISLIQSLLSLLLRTLLVLATAFPFFCPPHLFLRSDIVTHLSFHCTTHSYSVSHSLQLSAK